MRNNPMTYKLPASDLQKLAFLKLEITYSLLAKAMVNLGESATRTFESLTKLNQILSRSPRHK